MNSVFLFLRGYVRIRINGASPDRFVNILCENRIPFWDLIWYDAFTVELNVFSKDLHDMQHVANRAMCDIVSAQKIGAMNICSDILKRPVLILGVLVSILTVLFAQNYLLFYDVSGSETVSDAEIIRILDSIGVGIGDYGPDIKPKWIKDHVLQVVPELQWITVTQNGSMAHVVVRERPVVPYITDRKGYANVVASHGGLITQQSVYEGQAIKAVGDIVSEGDLLVSGIVDLERLYSVVHAQAEIFARTWHESDVVIPHNCMKKEYLRNERLCIWLEFGKRCIKIFGNSGISDGACDKMISKHTLTLPGDHQLPVCFVVERFLPYKTLPSKLGREEAQLMLETYAVDSVMKQMTAGQVLNESKVIDCADGCYRLKASFECHEMIAKTVEGKWKKEDFLND